MLLAGLQGKHEAASAFRVGSLAHDTAGELAHILALAGKESHIGSAVAERNAERLAVAHSYVSAPFRRRLQHCKGGRITIFNKEGACGMNRIGYSRKVLNDAMAADGGNYHAGDIRSEFFQDVPGIDDFDVRVFQIGLDDVEHVLHQLRGYNHLVALASAGDSHPEGLSGGGRAVVHRGVGNIHAGKTADHALPLEDVTQSSLRNLALVRRICSQELGTGGDVWNHGRHVMVVRALSDEHFQLRILPAESVKEITNFLLAESIRKFVFLFVDEIRGHVGVEIVQAADTNPLQHYADIIFSMGKICESSHLTWRFLHKRRH